MMSLALPRAVVRAGVAAACTAALAIAAGTLPTRAQSPVTPLDTPGTDTGATYALATGADGHARLVWIERGSGDEPHVLRFARFDGAAWGEPREIARGRDWFVNWADHPSITALPDGTLLVHWLVNTGKKSGSYGYGIRVVRSTDEGRTWQPLFEDGMANVSDYAGFLTFAPAPGGGVEAIYLNPLTPDDGSEHAHEGASAPVKTLAAVTFGADGTVSGRQVVDADVCSCCMTDITHTADGPVAVYRDHQPGEIRDISIVRRVGGRWLPPATVHRDGWEIAACPTNGPAIAARDRRVAVAWFTAAGQTPRLKLAWSDDGGATFAAPVVIDEGSPVGWPDLVMLEDGSVLVSWLERRGQGVGEVLVRRVRPGQAAGTPLVVAQAVSGRATGVPHMARVGDRVLLAWKHERVRTAAVPIAAIP